ncbi:MAG: outer membrane beta-barrel protein [Thiotrichaceae bacterium]|nr:outer membrane beta-barrel protein [Thiotrichaceae bacterium]
MWYSLPISLISLLLISTIASAQSDPLSFKNPFTPKSSNAGGNPVYVGGSIGSATADDFCTSGSSCSDSDIGWKAFAGYDVNNLLAIEAGYSSLGKMKSGSTTSEVSGFELAAVGKMALNNQVGIFGKAGVFNWTADNSAGERSSTDIMYGLGADYKINDNISIRGEWENFNDIETRNNQTSDVQMLSVGATYRTL